MRNWKKVIRTPEFGYRDVTCSRVMALLSEGLSFRMQIYHDEYPLTCSSLRIPVKEW
jgi:hypothetical protein